MVKCKRVVIKKIFIPDNKKHGSIIIYLTEYVSLRLRCKQLVTYPEAANIMIRICILLIRLFVSTLSSIKVSKFL